MNIVGIEKSSFIDYPNNICTVVFTGGCNFRCPYCHNSSAVNNIGDRIDEEEVIGFLKTITDYDGNIYITIQLGEQVWMAENLKTTHYRDGSSIPNVISGSSWANLNSGAYCYYDNNSANGDIY